MTKRKITYEQDQALEYGRSIARRNQRQRVAVRQAADKAQAERERQLADHIAKGFHSWKNWEYNFENMTETRVCRECGATETREIRL
jgi:hypothetical protein